LGKSKSARIKPLALLEGLLPIYEEVLERLAAAGAAWVQIDEPALACELSAEASAALQTAYARLAAVHLDLVRAPEQLQPALELVGAGRMLSLGIINGRNIRRADFERALALAEQAAARLGNDRIMIGPSCPRPGRCNRHSGWCCRR